MKGNNKLQLISFVAGEPYIIIVAGIMIHIRIERQSYTRTSW